MCLNKTIIIVILGTLLEWMEFSFFAYMTDYLSGVFFPIDSPDFARLKIYGAFAASYLMRPVGAIFFGYLGDKYGRKLPMIMSLIVMGISTFASPKATVASGEACRCSSRTSMAYALSISFKARYPNSAVSPAPPQVPAFSSGNASAALCGIWLFHKFCRMLQIIENSLI